MSLSGPVTAASVLLVVGGATKLRRPGNAVQALRALGLPAVALAVRLLAVAEMGIGMAAIAQGGRLMWSLVAVSYLGFAGFVLFARAQGGGVSSCGCFGGLDTAPTLTHVLLGLSASGLAFAAAFTHPPGPLLDGLRSQPLLGVPFVILTGCCAWFAYAAIAILPATAAFSTGER